MKVLAFDTSTEKIVVAVLNGDRRVFCSRVSSEKHAKALAPFLKSVLEYAELEVRDVEILGLGIGPGNLTGLRIGVSTALGMASVTGARIVPINSLELISLNFPTKRRAVVRKARKGYVYAQIFPDDGEPRVYPVEEFEKRLDDDVILLGDGAELFDGNVLPKRLWYPTPEALLDTTLERVDSAVEYIEIEPLYVQKSIAELNLERRGRDGV